MSDPLDPHYPEDREHQGEAGLGDAQSDEPALDPEMLGDADDEELTEVPALEPMPDDGGLDEAEEAAAAEAGAIGGVTGEEGIPEAERPLAESGEGEAEGFEMAEEQLIESASHGTPSGHPSGDRLPVEDAASEGLASYGEADHVDVSEDDLDDEDESG